jgi:hypothetical protein
MTDPKCELGEVEKAMFPGIGRLWNLIFCRLVIPKFNSVEIGKAILRRIDRNRVLIFCLMVVSKCHVTRSRKRCPMVRYAQRIYILSSGRLKMKMFWSREGDVPIGRLNYRTIFCLLAVPKWDLVEVK